MYSIEGRIVDFESGAESDNVFGLTDSEDHSCPVDSNFMTEVEELVQSSTLKTQSVHLDQLTDVDRASWRLLSIRTLESWFDMISGIKEIMEKYRVWTCGYCTEVQVGPKGHKVRMCKASKHQSRNGLHAWQEATTDDIVGPNYVWHVRDSHEAPLENSLKRYYGKAPAVVELCVQTGAPVPGQYRSMMRLDVVPPDRDEVDLVA